MSIGKNDFFPILWQENIFLKNKHMNYSCYNDRRLQYQLLEVKI